MFCGPRSAFDRVVVVCTTYINVLVVKLVRRHEQEGTDVQLWTFWSNTCKGLCGLIQASLSSIKFMRSIHFQKDMFSNEYCRTHTREYFVP
jgi:hypothetical protein